jgi:membrane protease YdiL (CAAX protease family)
MVAVARPLDQRVGAPLLLAAAAGSLALALRPAGVPAAVLTTASVGAIGLVASVAGDAGTPRPTVAAWWLALAVGLVAFVAGRTHGHAAAPGWWMPAALGSAVAAVAEEAFFRRLVYGMLAHRGGATAIAGAALLFALVHLPAYGVSTMPINLAAGLVLGWQRWATGGWSVPALTHLAANMLYYTT